MEYSNTHVRERETETETERETEREKDRKRETERETKRQRGESQRKNSIVFNNSITLMCHCSSGGMLPVIKIQ